MTKEKQGGKREGNVDKLKNQQCPFCHKKALALMEELVEVPFFGPTYLFSMNCSNCKYNKSDVEAAEKKPACKYAFEVNNEKDLKVRIVKSSTATLKIPHVTTVTPGPAAIGYISNVEGVLQRVMDSIRTAREDADDDADKKKAKNLMKKLQKVMYGQEKLKMVIEDPEGNSAIISEKAIKSKV